MNWYPCQCGPSNPWDCANDLAFYWPNCDPQAAYIDVTIPAPDIVNNHEAGANMAAIAGTYRLTWTGAPPVIDVEGYDTTWWNLYRCRFSWAGTDPTGINNLMTIRWHYDRATFEHELILGWLPAIGTDAHTGQWTRSNLGNEFSQFAPHANIIGFDDCGWRADCPDNSCANDSWSYFLENQPIPDRHVLILYSEDAPANTQAGDAIWSGGLTIDLASGV